MGQWHGSLKLQGENDHVGFVDKFKYINIKDIYSNGLF